MGMDFTALVNKLVEVATARYFGVTAAPSADATDDPKTAVFNFLEENRDKLEEKTKEWVSRFSRTEDPVGLSEARRDLASSMKGFGLGLRLRNLRTSGWLGRGRPRRGWKTAHY